MKKFIAPNLRDGKFYICFFLLTASIFFFAYWSDKSPSRNGLLIFGFLWISFIVVAWVWVGRFVRSLAVEQDKIFGILQNGKKYELHFMEFEKVKVINRIGYCEVVIRYSNGGTLLVTSHIDGFEEFEKLLEEKGFLEFPKRR